MTILITNKVKLNFNNQQWRTQLPMKSSEECCHFVMATDDNKPKQNNI